MLASMPNNLNKNPPKRRRQGLFVREKDRSWPTQVDSVAVDAGHHDRHEAALILQFPLVAKIIVGN